jgi:hypothetical protein
MREPRRQVPAFDQWSRGRSAGEHKFDRDLFALVFSKENRAGRAGLKAAMQGETAIQ